MNEATYLDVLSELSDGVAVFTKEFKIKYINRAFENVTGFQEEELERGFLKKLQSLPLEISNSAHIQNAIASEEIFKKEILLRHKSGKIFWCDLSIKPHFDPDGSIRHFMAILRDITDRKSAQGKAEELEGNYRFVLDNVLAGVVVHGPDTAIRFVNRLAAEVLRMDEAQLAGVSTADPRWIVFREDGSPMPVEEFPANQAIRKRAPVKGIVHGLKRPDGDEIFWLVANALPVLDDQGEVLEVLVSFSEITRLVESEREARSSRQRFELAARATQDAIFEWDIRTGQFWANEAYKTIYGYDPPDKISLDHLEVLSAVAAEHDKMRQTTLDAINSGKERYSLEYEFQRHDGMTGLASVRAFIVRGSNGEAERIIGTTTDIGKLTEANAALQLSEQRFRIIADATSDVLYDYDFKTNQTWSCADWPKKLGLPFHHADMQNFDWIEIVAPQDRERLTRSFRDAIKSDAAVWECEFKALNPEGEPFDLALKASILRDPDGRASRILGNMRNVTKEKRYQEGYTRARALEAVGQLTGGVAHDFNNLLMIILGNAELLEATSIDEEQAEAVALIRKASSSAADLTQRLLTFSRQSQLQTGCVELTELIPNTAALLRTGLLETITIACDVKPGVWQASADANALEQAIINLAVNARDAMPEGGKIVIGCDNRTIAAGTPAHPLDLRPGDYVVVSVTDTGVGMPPEVLAKVFEPFFTTKEVGKGTGLGLSTVYGFARQSGGQVTIHSEPGRGTRVEIYVPRFRKADGDAVSLPASGQARPAAGQRILLVEDNPLVRAHVEKLLTRLGYQVCAAEHAKEALSLLRSGREFELLFTDVIMPGGMTGPQLGEAALEILPELRILYTSGYPASAFENSELEQVPVANFLAKPYKSAQLMTKISDILEA